MKLLCIGDYIEDRYVFGTASRLCPEAPVPVIIPQTEQTSDGGVGLVFRQLQELGAQLRACYGSHSKKLRYFAGSHLVCRIDQDDSNPTPIETSGIFLYQFDAFIISDYGKGALTQELARMIVATGKPIFVDAKPHWHWYAGSNVTIFPNDREAGTAPTVIDPTQVFHSCEYGRIVHKLGKDGCRLQEPGRDIRLPATVSEVVDVCGAGDTFMAAFVYAWSLQLPTECCLEFANVLAGEACRHLGTYVVPRPFAEAVLDRLRVSRESQPQVRENFHGSIPLRIPPPPLPQSWNASASERADSLHGGWSPGREDHVEVVDILRLAQIPQRSPLTPTGSSDTRTPSDRETADEPNTK